MGQIEHDNYPTPQKLADVIVEQEYQGGIVPAVIIEPSCGAGAFIRACRDSWPQARIIGVDIVGRYRQHALEAGADEFVQAPWESVAQDILETERERGRVMVIGNPPFSFAQLHIEKALDNMNQSDVLTFLLRASFFGSVFRANSFWIPRRHQFHGFTPIAGRPSYVVFAKDPVTGKRKKKTTTDNSEYGLYHFIKDGPTFRMSLPPIINPPLLWKGE